MAKGYRTHTGKAARGSARGKASPAASVLYGINPVEAALRAGRRRLTELLLQRGPPSDRLSRLRELTAAPGIPVSEHSAPHLQALCGSPDHQGALLRCGPLPLLNEAAALALAGQQWRGVSGPPLLVALDQVEDPRNLGAVVRCCAAFGAGGLVIGRDHRAPLSAAASRASAGALETFPIHEVPNLARFLAQGKRRGFWVAGTLPEGGSALTGFTHDQPLILVLGNEGRGMRPLVRRHCDFLLTVPLPGGGSLNVAAAAAIVLFQITCHR